MISDADYQAAGIGLRYHFTAGMCGAEFTIPAGGAIGKHTHGYDHFSALQKGRVRLRVDGVDEIHEAPKLLTIAAGKSHEVHALTDVVWVCLHATSEADEHVRVAP